MTKIVAVIVTYNPPGDLLTRVSAVIGQVSKLIIVDNGSEPATQDILKNAAAQFSDRLELISNGKNKGLAVALNQGIKSATKQEDVEWVLLLDHDSQPQSGMIARMLETYNSHSDKENIGIIAPEILDKNTSSPTKYLVPIGKVLWFKRIALNTKYNDEVLSVITSGSMIRTDMFGKIGMMPEHFFIDYIDHYFCLGIKRRGYKILLVKDTILQHELGEKTEHNLLGVRVGTTNHSPTRRFYIFRNRIWVWKEYIMTFPNFVMHDLLAAWFDIFRVTLFENQKISKLTAIMRGILAGLRQEP